MNNWLDMPPAKGVITPLRGRFPWSGVPSSLLRALTWADCSDPSRTATAMAELHPDADFPDDLLGFSGVMSRWMNGKRLLIELSPQARNKLLRPPRLRALPKTDPGQGFRRGVMVSFLGLGAPSGERLREWYTQKERRTTPDTFPVRFLVYVEPTDAGALLYLWACRETYWHDGWAQGPNGEEAWVQGTRKVAPADRGWVSLTPAYLTEEHRNRRICGIGWSAEEEPFVSMDALDWGLLATDGNYPLSIVSLGDEEHPPKWAVDGTLPAIISVNAAAAYWATPEVFTAPSKKGKGKKRLGGVSGVRRLTLSEDGCRVIEQRQAEEETRDESPRQREPQGPRSPVSLHRVDPHDVHLWVREPNPGEEILGQKEGARGRPLFRVKRLRGREGKYIRGHELRPAASRMIAQRGDL